MIRLKAIAAPLAGLTVWTMAGPAAAQAPSCSLPAKAMVRAELLFGRNIDGRPGVSDDAFARFVAREITPRFPDGLTVIDAAGQWRDPATGRILREKSKMVILIVEDGAAARARIDAIATSDRKSVV